MNDITYKLTELEVPPDDPFSCDALNREPSVEAVSSLIGELSGPFVLAIDSPWGTGKTTFVRMLKAVLEKKEHPCLYFNAWETDFSTDPLVAFLGEISTLLSEDISKDSALAKNYNKAKKIAGKLAKRGLPLAAKLLTNGLLGFDPTTEKILADGVSETVSDAVDEYIKEKGLIEEFRKTLGKVIEQLNQEGKSSQIIIFVDEIDRCRPTYAVELLERIKHLFNIENVIFVVSLDKQQLRTSLGAVYGQGINADEYLRRFIDLEFLLPKPDAEAFTKSLFERFRFEAFFKKRTHTAFRYEPDNLLRAFTALSDVFDLSLRAREQCFTMIRIAMMATDENQHFHPYLLIILILLRTEGEGLEVYRHYAFGEGTAKDVIEYLSSKKGGTDMLLSHEGTVVEAYLLAAKSGYDGSEELREYEAVVKDSSIDQSKRERSEKLLRIVKEISDYGLPPSLSSQVSKIELVTRFK